MSEQSGVAIQDLYGPSYRHCFGCGPDREDGWRVRSYLDGDVVRASFTPDPRYSGGVPENLFGGVLAALLDCHGTASAAAFWHLSAGFQLGREPLARCVTARLAVDFLRPTPLDEELRLESRLERVEGRKVELRMSVWARGEERCRAQMLAVRVRDE